MKKLETMTAEQLQSAPYAPVPFLVDELLPEGLHILAGAPKIGKSWLALWLCLCVSQGQPLWNFAVTQGEVLYRSLEDSYRRIQSRLFDLTEDAPSALHVAIMADTLKHGLEQQIEQFLTEHPATKLVVIDTLQRVRSAGGDSNLYANDYQDVGLLKQLADKHHIAILLIHHLRKLHDDDPMNMISGSTGLSGAADSTFVLQKNARSANAASLHCTGRDIPDRTLRLELGEDDHVWKLLSDSKTCSGASRVYLKTPDAPGQRAFSRCAAPFFLEIRQYSCVKMSCSTQKSLAAGHIESFQIHPKISALQPKHDLHRQCFDLLADRPLHFLC